MRQCHKGIFFGALLGFFLGGCAAEDGDAVECPVCDASTEALVGTQCVPLAEIVECGPDGHGHDGFCHCYGGQEVTEIDGKNYCLQEVCGVISPVTEEEGEYKEEGHEHDEESDAHTEEAGSEHSDEGDAHGEDDEQSAE